MKHVKLPEMVLLPSLLGWFALGGIAQVMEHDPSFGTNGITELMVAPGYNYYPEEMVELADGSLLIATTTGNETIGSSVMITKLDASGQPDNSFFPNGSLIGTFGMTKPYVSDLKLQADGKILLSGFHKIETDTGAHDDLFLLRLLPDGSLDPSFALGGKFTYDSGGKSQLTTQILVQPDGNILLTTHQRDQDNHEEKIVLLRLTETGALDYTFNSIGIKEYGTNRYDSIFPEFTSVLQPDGKIVLAISGQYQSIFTLPGIYDSARVVRLNPDGTPDLTFDEDGEMRYKNGTILDVVGEIAIQNDGSILISGIANSMNPMPISPNVTKLTPNGQISTDFGIMGVATITEWSDYIGAHFRKPQLKLLPTNEIIVGYNQSHQGDTCLHMWHLAVLDQNGNLNTTFGENGLFGEQVGPNPQQLITDLMMRQNGQLTLLIRDGISDLFEQQSVLILQYGAGGNSNALTTVSAELQMGLYPNPTQGAFNLFIAHPEQVHGITILDPSGKVVQTYNGPISSHTQLDLSALARGTYFVQVAHAGSSTMQQLILN